MRCPGWLILVGALLAVGAAGAFQPRDRAGFDHSRATRAEPFQTGISIDWTGRSVRAAGRVVLRSGPLEFVACGPGKEHESLILLEGSATHLYQALGLVGFEPGHPPQWDETNSRYRDPVGSLLDIAVAWETSSGPQETSVFSWIREVGYARTARPVPWVFGGSRVADGNRLAADVSGSVVALVDFADSLFSLTRRRSAVDASAWAHAHTDAIPPLGTTVTLVFRKPSRTPPRMRIDSRGDIRVDGRYERLAGVIDLIRIARRLDTNHVQVIEIVGTLESDLRRVRSTLVAALSNEAIRMRRD